MVTDVGIFYIANELASLTLHEIGLTFGKTQLTDEGLVSLAESLAKISSRLSTFWLSAFMTKISDSGALALCNALTSISSWLTKLDVNLRDCPGVTDRSKLVLSKLEAAVKANKEQLRHSLPAR
eukprot:TRINITY_DN9488_c0_g1_i1.p2 TRINITY_DN9488_c0_g1~~TRINITY_DN9488_c0_g1_i1.p2  ORF type:complete len:124 (+),score=16.73 TRINITY_DN9488_c0_g1_i1:1400-1771(+)